MRTKTLEDFKGESIIDSRDVEARIDELESEVTGWEDTKTELEEQRADLATELSDADTPAGKLQVIDLIEGVETDLQAHIDTESDLADLRAELKTLTDFRDEVGSREWTHGLALINEDYFEDYAQQFAEDIGATNRDMSWPYTCIDWKQAANDLRQDYSSAELDGETYLYQD